MELLRALRDVGGAVSAADSPAGREISRDTNASMSRANLCRSKGVQPSARSVRGGAGGLSVHRRLHDDK